MSLNLIARDLYRLIREVEALGKKLAASSPEKRPKIEAALRKARAERDELRDMVDAKKEPWVGNCVSVKCDRSGKAESIQRT